MADQTVESAGDQALDPSDHQATDSPEDQAVQAEQAEQAVQADQALDLDLLASSLQADGGDVRILLKVLIGRLSGALGDRLVVERAGGRFKKSEEIRRVTVQLGNDTLDAAVRGGTLECTVARSSGGIRIRSAKVSMDEWLRQLLGSLRDEAANSNATRQALESIVIGDEG